MKELEIYIDGASKGNPGPSGIGVVIYCDKRVVKNISSYIGDATNNVAEYTALIHGLQEALKLKAQVVKINTDSQLLSRQMKKAYKVKSPAIAELYNQASNLLDNFKQVFIKDISREYNRQADKLATQAVEKQLKHSVKQEKAVSDGYVLLRKS